MKEKHIDADSAAEKIEAEDESGSLYAGRNGSSDNKTECVKAYPYSHMKGGILIPTEEQ